MKKILVNINFKNDPEVQLQKALRLAKLQGAHIELFCCCYNRSIVQGYIFDKDQEQHAEHGYMKQIENRLEQLAKPIENEGIAVGVDVCWNRNHAEGVIRKALRFQPDLIIHAVQPHTRLGHYLFASVDWQLARQAPVPVLFVKQRKWIELNRILACVDPLHEGDQVAEIDRAILDNAQHLAEQDFAELNVLHTFNTLPHDAIFDEHMVTDYEALRVKVEQHHHQACNALLQPYGLSTASEQVVLLHGEAESVISEYSHQIGADVLVMGVIARGVLDRFLVGSTLEYVVDHVEADVLVVKPAGFESPVSE